MTVHFADGQYTFANGYGASVIHDPHNEQLAEIAVTNDRGEFVYDTPITQDVRPRVDPFDIQRILDQIAALPPRPSDAPSGPASRLAGWPAGRLMTTDTTNPAACYGPVAAREFDAAADYAKPKLTVWLQELPGLSDEDFFWKAAMAIHDSALTNSFRGNWSAEDCKASAAYAEAQQRHTAAGHSSDCTGDTIYSKAFAQVWREQGHDPAAYPARACDCGADR